MHFLRQSTAWNDMIGPFIDENDGKTPEIGLTIVRADVKLSKNGGDYAQKDNVTSATHKDGGDYLIPFATTDAGTVGRMKLKVHPTGSLPVWKEYHVLSQPVYDLLFGAATPKVDLDETHTKNSGKLLGVMAGAKIVTPDGTDRKIDHKKIGVPGTTAHTETIDENGNTTVP